MFALPDGSWAVHCRCSLKLGAWVRNALLHLSPGICRYHTHTHIFPVRRDSRWSLWWQFFLAWSWTVCGSCQYEDQSAPKGWRGIFQAQLFPWPTLGANQWKDERLHHKGLVHLMVHKFANLKNVIISVKETSCFYGEGDRVLPTGSQAGSKQAKR